MKDILKQEIKEGSKVLWMAGKTQYSGSKILTVLKITDKRVRLSNDKSIDPNDIVVIDKLLIKGT